MKRWIIGSLIGAILLFAWQFIAWGVIGLHDSELKYHPDQEKIISSLSSTLKEDGRYMVPRAEPGLSHEEAEKVMEANFGKPYAIIMYKSQLENRMAAQMIRGFLIDLVIALILTYLLGSRISKSMGSTITASLAVGFLAWLAFPYLEHNWFQTPVASITSSLLDILVGFGILGLWLGYWLNRGAKDVA